MQNRLLTGGAQHRAAPRSGLLFALLFLLSACGGGSSAPPPATYAIGGSISGLRVAGLVLQNNGGSNLSVPAGASSFRFSTPVASGSTYDVTVLTSPPGPPAQSCTVQNGSGTVSSVAPVINVACITAASEILVGIDGTGTIYGYPIDPDTGALRSASVTMAAGAAALATDPTGKWVYSASLSENTVSGYQVSSAAGLQDIPGSPFAAPNQSHGLVIEPAGRYLYVTAGLPGLLGYAINSASGALTPIAGSPFPAPAYSAAPAVPPLSVSCQLTCAATPSALFATINYAEPAYALAGFSIDSATGALRGTVTTTLPAANGTPYDVVIDPSGNFLYASMPGALGIYGVDSIAASVTSIGALNPPTIQWGSVAAEPSGKYLYASAGYIDGGALLEQFRIDPATGLPTNLAPPLAGQAGTTLVVIDRTGRFLYAVAGTSAYGYSIDTSTGLLTALAGSPFAISASLTAASTALIP